MTISGLGGGSGKTLVSLGLARAMRLRGLVVAPFKKGPDYIDAAWLSLAAGREASNLDVRLFADGHEHIGNERVRALFAARCSGADVALIEGNRGLFDGFDVTGSLSTAQLARLVCAPVFVVLDATKMTRTAAAIVAGLNAFEPGFALAGVILNRTAGERHRTICREAIEYYTDTPVVGALPKMANPIPERHMGLVGSLELADADDMAETSGVADVEAVLDTLAARVAECVDMDRVLELAAHPAPPDAQAPSTYAAGHGGGLAACSVCDLLSGVHANAPAHGCPPVRIGYVRDSAFWFYYRENLEALAHAGAELVEISLLDSTLSIGSLDGLYIGGGFPETHAEPLAHNTAAHAAIRAASEAGMPIYGECGGFMYLCEELTTPAGDGARTHRMAGVFPLRAVMHPRPQGLGYVDAHVHAENPFHPVGTVLRGHEFHYSRCEATGTATIPSCTATLSRGAGIVEADGTAADGICTRNTWGSYTHIHALGAPHWAGRFVAAARKWRASRTTETP